MKSKFSFLVAVMLGAAAVAGAAEGIFVHKKVGKFDRVKIITGVGKSNMELISHNWGNTYAQMASGKYWNIIDPFFYNLRTAKITKYLNNPALWTGMKYDLSADKKTIVLKLQPAGSAFEKAVKIRMVPGKNILYVTSQITNTTDQKQKLIFEEQYIWQKNIPDIVFTVDGKKIATDKKSDVDFKNWFAIFNKKRNISCAVILLGQNKANYVVHGPSGVDFHWGRPGRVYAPKQVKTQKYIIIWDDGDVTSAAQKLSAQAVKGELDKEF